MAQSSIRESMPALSENPLGMRTCVEFTSEKFPSYGNIDEAANYDEGVYGQRLAEYLGKNPALERCRLARCASESG